MKQLFVLLSNLFFLFSFAQDLPNSLLWKVEKEGIQPSFIFGTIHVLPQADFQLDEKVKTAIGESDELVMEMDMSDPSLQTKMFQMMNMRDGTTLDQLLTKEQYEMLSKKLQGMEGAPPLAMLNGMKPFMVATMMLSEYVGSQPASFEMTLTSMATARQMPISGLETIEEQMAVFDSISYSDQAEDLMDMVEKGDEMKQLFADMIAQYKAEEVNALFASTEEYMASEEEMKFLLYARNENWAERLETRLGEKTLFIGVGAAHLGGEQGIITLLRERGYELTPIMD
ncbi:TraB/GumN family protein [Cryomorphaceae bacterium 1068]|nr:TraB/GumN family protein [Cryomorphaceae bacterium 1068]